MNTELTFVLQYLRHHPDLHLINNLKMLSQVYDLTYLNARKQLDKIAYIF